jgi:hypothetical protein
MASYKNYLNFLLKERKNEVRTSKINVQNIFVLILQLEKKLQYADQF